MSPQQVQGDSLEVDARSDIFAPGAILYELPAGKLPCNVTRNVCESCRWGRWTWSGGNSLRRGTTARCEESFVCDAQSSAHGVLF